MTEREFLRSVLHDRGDAVALCEQLFRASQLIDDLHDGDKTVTPAQRQALIWEMLVAIPENVFYRRHFAALQPLVRAALNDWLDSTDLEATGDAHDGTLAFVLRDQLTAVVSQCAYIVGGYDWMRSVSAQIRRHFHDETLDDYRASITQEAS